ncbi:MAG: YARHG domain-containing protein [Oscillospiraceae bacterium]|nr:YARHG domain-containing protein [Oscillospiraceae bacterium]
MLLVLVLVATAAVVGGYLFLHGNSAKNGGESTGESQSFLAEESEAVETTATETDYETESQDVESSYETEAQTTEEQETQVAQEASEPAIERYFQGELVTTGDYILPDSDTRLYSVDELAGMTATQLRLARNEIYARHGRLFKDDELQAYFNACDWYSGTVSWDSFDDAVFSATEKANIVTIQEAEARLG